jgi:membrane protein DedA with SNARE-associated domain/membrane-associated phospholipid phosphatase
LRKHRKKLVLAALVVLVVVLYATGVLPKLPRADKVIEDLATALGPYTYVLVGVLAYLETGAFVGLVAPGESAVIVGGVVAGQGEISLVALIGLVWTCAVLGDTTSFFIGRRLGRDFMLRHGPKLKIDEDRLAHVEGYFRRHGGATIVIGRFIGLVRALSPFVAGSSGLPYRRFVPFSIIGCGLWATLFCVLGYVFYRSFDKVTAVAGKATLAFGITVAVIVGVVYAYRRLRREEARRRFGAWVERQGRRPLLRPLFAVMRPAWRGVRAAMVLAAPRVRFVRDRLAPGTLGLELITVLAISGVGCYIFTLYAVVLAGDPGLTPADRELLDLGDELRSEVAVDVAKVVTELGSLVTATALLLAVASVLFARRHVTKLVALLVGALLLYVAVGLAKSGIDRPRPPLPLESTEGSSFPSGHAAYSTLWVAAAVAVGEALPGFASRAALAVAGVAVAVAVGLSRIYLRVHYWSDVAGGWALGAGVLGACAGALLVVEYVRHNEPETG